MNSRRFKIKLALMRLVITNADGGYMSREDDLYNDLVTFIRPTPVTSEVKDILAECDREKLLVGVLEENVMRFDVTAQGRAWKLKQEQG